MNLTTRPLKVTVIQSRVRMGLGSGCRETYRSFFNRRDFRHVSTHLFFWQDLNRHVVLIGRQRYAYFLDRFFTDYDQLVDLREFPYIPTEETKQAADSLNLRHPVNSYNQLIPLCPDFELLLKTPDGIRHEMVSLTSDQILARIQNGDPPISFQQYDLMIRSAWCERKHIPHLIVPYSMLNPIRTRNIQRVLASCRLDLSLPEEALAWFQTQYTSTRYCVDRLAEECCDRFHLPPGSGINVFFRLVWLRRIHPDMNHRPFFLSETRDCSLSGTNNAHEPAPLYPIPALYAGSLFRAFPPSNDEPDKASDPTIPEGLFRVLFADSRSVYLISCASGICSPLAVPRFSFEVALFSEHILPANESPLLQPLPENEDHPLLEWARLFSSYPLPWLLRSPESQRRALREAAKIMQVHRNTAKRYFSQWLSGGMTVFSLLSPRSVPDSQKGALSE